MQSTQIKMSDDKLLAIVEVLMQIEGDNSVPKNVRGKIKDVVLMLNEGENSVAVRVDKSLQELDELSDDPNVPVYTKTQIWNVVSLLESIA